MRTIPILVLLTAAVLAQASESKLVFADLRVQGGVMGSSGVGGAISLMAGDIGDKTKHTIDLDQDMGVVLGLRAQYGQGIAVRGRDEDIDLTGGVFLGGLGFYASKTSHVELLFAWGVGMISASGPTINRDEGRYMSYGGELGWYWMMTKRLQLGIVGGYTHAKITTRDPTGRVDAEKLIAGGIDAGVAVGWRF
jgi:hypothetical protein